MIAQTPQPATKTTTHLQLPTALLITRTARLRAWARQFDPYELAIVGSLLLVVLVATIVANWPAAQPAVPAQPIIVFRDRVVVATPTLGLPAPAEEPPAAMVEQAVPAPVESTPAPPAPAEGQPAELQVMSQPAPTVAPAPTVEAYWAAPNEFVVNGDTIPTVPPEMIGYVDSQGWVCGTKYGDSRDSNPMYVHPECYGPPPTQ